MTEPTDLPHGDPIIVSAETFDRLIEKLAKPPKPNAALRRLLEQPFDWKDDADD